MYSTRQIKVPVSGSTLLRNVITEDTLEPCHLHLVLSTSPTILLASSAKAIRLVDNTRLGDKALKCLL